MEARSWPAGALSSVGRASDLQAECREFQPRCVQLLAFTMTLQDDIDVTPEEGKSLEDVRWEQACGKLVSEAVRRQSGDNVTALLIRLSSRPASITVQHNNAPE